MGKLKICEVLYYPIQILSVYWRFNAYSRKIEKKLFVNIFDEQVFENETRRATIIQFIVKITA